MWIAFFLVLPLLSIAFPRVLNAWNLLFTFPVITVAFGSMAWAAINIFTGFSFCTSTTWILCTLFVGLPAGIFFVKGTLN